jgi:hypothetical protein
MSGSPDEVDYECSPIATSHDCSSSSLAANCSTPEASDNVSLLKAKIVEIFGPDDVDSDVASEQSSKCAITMCNCTDPACANDIAPRVGKHQTIEYFSKFHQWIMMKELHWVALTLRQKKDLRKEYARLVETSKLESNFQKLEKDKRDSRVKQSKAWIASKNYVRSVSHIEVQKEMYPQCLCCHYAVVLTQHDGFKRVRSHSRSPSRETKKAKDVSTHSRKPYQEYPDSRYHGVPKCHQTRGNQAIEPYTRDHLDSSDDRQYGRRSSEYYYSHRQVGADYCDGCRHAVTQFDLLRTIVKQLEREVDSLRCSVQRYKIECRSRK